MSNAASISEQTLAAIGALFGDRATRSEAICMRHARSEAYHVPLPPDVVVFPESTAEVQRLVRLCASARVPVIAYGAGTSLEGNTSAPRGGVCLDMSRMDRVLAVNTADLDCRVGPGITRKALNAALRDIGLFFPIDPGADASIGGMVSTRASGTMAMRYGTMRDNVLALEVVLANGEVIRTSRRARRSSAGYDLTRLFVGAEGTLGVITEVTLRLHPVPEAIGAAVFAFNALEDTVNCVIAMMQAGVAVARIDLLDAMMIRGVNACSKLEYPELPTLFLEFHGTANGVLEQSRKASDIADEFRCEGFQWATRPDDRSRLWTARDDTFHAAIGLRPGLKPMITDVCVPISRLAECLLAAADDIEASGLIVPIVGHVGDGNFHLLILVDSRDEDELARAKHLHDGMVARALALDGTCTGEHGVGAGETHFLEAELGGAVDVMRAVKAALDPLGIMSPGKIFAVRPQGQSDA